MIGAAKKWSAREAALHPRGRRGLWIRKLFAGRGSGVGDVLVGRAGVHVPKPARKKAAKRRHQVDVRRPRFVEALDQQIAQRGKSAATGARPRVAAKKTTPSAPVDVSAQLARLRAVHTAADARSVLAGLRGASLREVARRLGYHPAQGEKVASIRAHLLRLLDLAQPERPRRASAKKAVASNRAAELIREARAAVDEQMQRPRVDQVEVRGSPAQRAAARALNQARQRDADAHHALERARRYHTELERLRFRHRHELSDAHARALYREIRNNQAVTGRLAERIRDASHGLAAAHGAYRSAGSHRVHDALRAALRGSYGDPYAHINAWEQLTPADWRGMAATDRQAVLLAVEDVIRRHPSGTQGHERAVTLRERFARPVPRTTAAAKRTASRGAPTGGRPVRKATGGLTAPERSTPTGGRPRPGSAARVTSFYGGDAILSAGELHLQGRSRENIAGYLRARARGLEQEVRDDVDSGHLSRAQALLEMRRARADARALDEWADRVEADRTGRVGLRLLASRYQSHTTPAELATLATRFGIDARAGDGRGLSHAELAEAVAEHRVRTERVRQGVADLDRQDRRAGGLGPATGGRPGKALAIRSSNAPATGSRPGRGVGTPATPRKTAAPRPRKVAAPRDWVDSSTGREYEIMPGDPNDPGATYVSVGQIAREDFGQQAQYFSRLINPDYRDRGEGYMGEGLRVRGESGDYHSWRIDTRDVPELRRRAELKGYRLRPPSTPAKVARKSAASRVPGGTPAVDVDEPGVVRPRRVPRGQEAPTGTIRRELMALGSNEDRRAYLAGLGLNNTQARRLARYLGAQQSAMGVDGNLDNIVEYFDIDHEGRGTARLGSSAVAKTTPTKAAPQTGHVAKDAQARAGWKAGARLQYQGRGEVIYDSPDELDSTGMGGGEGGAHWVQFTHGRDAGQLGMVSGHMLSGYVPPSKARKTAAPTARKLTPAGQSHPGVRTGDTATWAPKGETPVRGKVTRRGDRLFVEWENGRREEIGAGDAGVTFEPRSPAKVARPAAKKTAPAKKFANGARVKVRLDHGDGDVEWADAEISHVNTDSDSYNVRFDSGQYLHVQAGDVRTSTKASPRVLAAREYVQTTKDPYGATDIDGAAAWDIANNIQKNDWRALTPAERRTIRLGVSTYEDYHPWVHSVIGAKLDGWTPARKASGSSVPVKKAATRASPPDAVDVERRLRGFRTTDEAHEYVDGLRLNVTQSRRLARQLGLAGTGAMAQPDINELIVRVFVGSRMDRDAIARLTGGPGAPTGGRSRAGRVEPAGWAYSGERRVGAPVVHPDFGRGQIESVSGSHASVRFEGRPDMPERLATDRDVQTAAAAALGDDLAAHFGYSPDVSELVESAQVRDALTQRGFTGARVREFGGDERTVSWRPEPVRGSTHRFPLAPPSGDARAQFTAATPARQRGGPLTQDQAGRLLGDVFPPARRGAGIPTDRRGPFDEAVQRGLDPGLAADRFDAYAAHIQGEDRHTARIYRDMATQLRLGHHTPPRQIPDLVDFAESRGWIARMTRGEDASGDPTFTVELANPRSRDRYEVTWHGDRAGLPHNHQGPRVSRLDDLVRHVDRTSPLRPQDRQGAPEQRWSWIDRILGRPRRAARPPAQVRARTTMSQVPRANDRVQDPRRGGRLGTVLRTEGHAVVVRWDDGRTETMSTDVLYPPQRRPRPDGRVGQPSLTADRALTRLREASAAGNDDEMRVILRSVSDPRSGGSEALLREVAEKAGFPRRDRRRLPTGELVDQIIARLTQADLDRRYGAPTGGPPRTRQDRRGLTVRPALTGSRDHVELSDAAAAEYRRLTGHDLHVAVGPHAHPLTAREHMEGLLRVAQRFPDTNLHSVAWYHDPADTAWARAGGRMLRANGHFSSAEGRRRYLRQLAEAVADWDLNEPEFRPGWHPRNSDSPAAVMVHEFAHILDRDSLGERLHPQVEALIRKRSADEGIPADRIIRREVSGYAAQGPPGGGPSDVMRELIAEAFTDAIINGDQAGRMSREILGLVQAEYDRGLAAGTLRTRFDGTPLQPGVPDIGPRPPRAPRQRRSMREILRDGDEQEIRRTLTSVYSGRHGDLRARVTGVEPNPNIRVITVRGEITDRDGRVVGSFTNGIGPDPADESKVVAYHANIDLEPDARARGFYRRFETAANRRLARLGVDRVELNASGELGGFVQARMGRDWRDEHAAQRMFDSLQTMAGFYRAYPGDYPGPDLQRALADADELLARGRRAKFGDPDFPTPLDISQVGRWDQAGPADSWLGKLALRGRSWDAVHHLNPSPATGPAPDRGDGPDVVTVTRVGDHVQVRVVNTGRVTVDHDRLRLADLHPDQARELADDIDGMVFDSYAVDPPDDDTDPTDLVDDNGHVNRPNDLVVGYDSNGDIHLLTPGGEDRVITADEASELAGSLRLGADRAEDAAFDQWQRGLLAAPPTWPDVYETVGETRLEMPDHTGLDVGERGVTGGEVPVPVDAMPRLSAALRDLHRRGRGLPEFDGDPDDAGDIHETDLGGGLSVALLEDGDLDLRVYHAGRYWNARITNSDAAQVADRVDQLHRTAAAFRPTPATGGVPSERMTAARRNQLVRRLDRRDPFIWNAITDEAMGARTENDAVETVAEKHGLTDEEAMAAIWNVLDSSVEPPDWWDGSRTRRLTATRRRTPAKAATPAAPTMTSATQVGRARAAKAAAPGAVTPQTMARRLVQRSRQRQTGALDAMREMLVQFDADQLRDIGRELDMDHEDLQTGSVAALRNNIVFHVRDTARASRPSTRAPRAARQASGPALTRQIDGVQVTARPIPPIFGNTRETYVARVGREDIGTVHVTDDGEVVIFGPSDGGWDVPRPAPKYESVDDALRGLLDAYRSPAARRAIRERQALHAGLDHEQAREFAGTDMTLNQYRRTLAVRSGEPVPLTGRALRAAMALDQWADGQGGPAPLEGFDRPTLRKVATHHGLTYPAAADEATLRRLLEDEVRERRDARMAVLHNPPKINDLFDLRNDYNGLRERIEPMLEGTFGGLSTRVGDAAVVGDTIRVEVQIFDQRGHLAGTADIQFAREGDGSIVAVHPNMQIQRNVRAGGFATEFGNRLMGWYPNAGVSEVQLTANIDVGGYAWARLGFDWDDWGAAQTILDRLHRTVLAAGNGRGSAKLRRSRNLQGQIAAAEALIQRAETIPFGQPGFPTPYEISQLGRWRGAGSMDRWIGNETMLGSSWDGVLRIPR